MRSDAYTLAAQVEEDHWWFRGRRAILRSVLNRYAPPTASPRMILEVGCGNGGNLPLLASYGRVCAVELDDGARSRASRRDVAQVEKGWLPDALPFGEERFDLIAALDVLEHVEEDRAAVRALHGRLGPHGLLVMTVPAYKWLWNRHDEFSEHKRRYRRDQLVALMSDVGFNVVFSSYFNTILFPIAVAGIQLGKLFEDSARCAMQIPPAPVNVVLEAVFSMESRLLPRVSFPYGVSILVCAFAR